MKSKKWIKVLLILVIVSINLLYLINYIVDPFNIFHTKFLEKQSQINERFLKIEYLEKNHMNYNSYMFGSSRIGTTHPSTVEKYIPDSHFYNLSAASATFYDYVKHLEYLIKEKYPFENLYLQIDIDHMANYKISTFSKKLHPFVLNESLYKFYIEHLNGFFPVNIKEKIKMNYFNNKEKKSKDAYLLEFGIWTNLRSEKKLIQNCNKYVESVASFHKKNIRGVRFSKKYYNRKALERILFLCNKNNINLYIYTMPHNKNMMDTYEVKDYLEFLKQLSSITDFYDFSGYNTITMNNCNYYEDSHYRPLVGKIIAGRIFNDKSMEIPDDFGVLVTEDNIDIHLESLREQIKNYDLNKSIE